MKRIKSCGFDFQVLLREIHFALTKASMFFLGISLFLTMVTGAQGVPPDGHVQEITSYIYPGEREVYDLPNLKGGDTLFVYMQHLSANLDP